ncbi:ATP-dependent sacrificial sulfur transferase LarE [Christensenellaceae bacterium OttesenSCG-928-L17]|nr:ATP-dependent sacrificial sulfur transferase LarE [Christensenellaceae bacterium OttesenSCG-928-L17]
MHTNKQLPQGVPQALAEALFQIPKAAVALSGGVDSSYLLYAAKACHVDVRAYYVHSPFQPQFEMDDATKIAEAVGVPFTCIPLDVLSCEAVKNNPIDRCYYCKRMILQAILERAEADGYATLLDGSNASDNAADRPGTRALRECHVRSPLKEAGLTKEDIRTYAKRAGLFTWNKPAYACLATRVPTGVELTRSLLERIAHAEDALFAMGFTDFRARVVGEAAKLQLPAAQMQRAAKEHAALVKALSPWFCEVLLDLTPRGVSPDAGDKKQ